MAAARAVHQDEGNLSRRAVRRDVVPGRHSLTHLVFGPSGALYFTDPPFGLVGQDKDPAKERPPGFDAAIWPRRCRILPMIGFDDLHGYLRFPTTL